jgi:hypothetical protein
MKRILGLSVILVLAAGMVAQAAISLTPVVGGDWIRFGTSSFYDGSHNSPSQSTVKSDYYGGGRGGAFVVSVSSNGGTGATISSSATYKADIVAFCTEFVTFNWETAYKVDSISNSLGDYGQWLYWNFASEAANNTGTGLFTSLSNTLGSAVQYGVWREAGLSAPYVAGESANVTAYESYITSGLISDFMDPVKDTLFAAFQADTYWGTITNDPVQVAVISGQNQSILAVVPRTAVPEPTTLMIWAALGGLGTAGVAMKRRKNRGGRWSDDNRQAILSIIER